MRIGIDLDQTIYPFVMAYRECVLTHRPELPWPLPKTSTYGFFKEWGISLEDFTEDLTTHADQLYKYPPHYEAITSIPRLASLGHEIYIVTSRVVAARKRTLQWCGEWFGDAIAGVVIGDDKTVIKTDIFIDDAPSQIERLRDHTRLIIMDQVYNQGIPGERVSSIYEFEALVREDELVNA